MTAAFQRRGVIEGFYGRPWTASQRLEFVDFIGARGMNCFAYAPKDDPLLRQAWQHPFAAEQVAHMAELRTACDRWGIRLLVCVSPGLTLRYADPADVAALTAKLEAAVAAGAHDVGLLLDDIPDRLQHPADRSAFDSLAQAQAQVVTELHGRLSAVPDRDEVGLAICPTLYCGYGDEDYLAELAAGLPASVDLFWTGRAICSTTLDLADADTFAATTGRPPWYWDNYPVNDLAMIWEAHLGPYRGRDPRLAHASRGVIANPMELFESSKIPIATIADFLSDPTGYEPEESWLRAITHVVAGPAPSPEGEADAAAFATYADNVRVSCLEPSDSPHLSRLLEELAFATAVGGPPEITTAAGAITAYAATLSAAVARIQSPRFSNPALATEQAPWLNVASIGAEALAALGGIVGSTAGLADAATAAQQIATAVAPHLARLRQQRHRVFGDVLDMTLADYVDLRHTPITGPITAPTVAPIPGDTAQKGTP